MTEVVPEGYTVNCIGDSESDSSICHCLKEAGISWILGHFLAETQIQSQKGKGHPSVGEAESGYIRRTPNASLDILNLSFKIVFLYPLICV